MTAKERAREVIETAYDSILESDEIISITERGLEEAIAQAILSAESRGRQAGLEESIKIIKNEMYCTTFEHDQETHNKACDEIIYAIRLKGEKYGDKD